MRRGIVYFASTWAWILILVFLTLAACGTQSGTPAMSDDAKLLNTPMGTSDPGVLAAVQTQQQNNTDTHAVATAEIMRADAQGTLNSANATLNAVQTQDQSDVNLVAAQIAATAEMAHANAQATLNSANSTQNAAFTQDAIRQTQMAAVATTSAQAMLDQQNKDELAASTQTAVANNIATQTQAAAVAAQWDASQARRLEERRRGPITFLWTWCLPVFIVLFAGLILWGFWRWLKIQQTHQLVLENPADRLPALVTKVMPYQRDDSSPHLESDIVNGHYQLTRPDDQIRRWLDEVKRTLRSSDKKDKDDNTDN
jgi:hypothetical protein